MEKLQIAIEQARQRRENKDKSAPEEARPVKKASPSKTPTRARTGPRLLPDDLMDRWAALPEIQLPKANGDARRLVAHVAGVEASPFDILRTKVLIEARKQGWRRIAITSPTLACGKTTTACNLAVSIARQGDLRTSLFDLDLRRPAVARLFMAKPQRDISEFLTGRTEYGDQAMRIGANLGVSMALQAQADPTQLLAGERISEILDRVDEDYAPDIMIFDLPPLLSSDDARAFLRNVDCAILMARAEYSTAQQIDVSEREIAEQTNVLGIVLNECRYDDNRQRASDY